MGLISDIFGEMFDGLASIPDAPGLPPGLGPAMEPVISDRDPDLSDIIDLIDDLNPGLPMGPADEAFKEGVKNVGDYTKKSPRAGKDKLDAIKDAKNKDPEGI